MIKTDLKYSTDMQGLLLYFFPELIKENINLKEHWFLQNTLFGVWLPYFI
jgi:hypothetical protein